MSRRAGGGGGGGGRIARRTRKRPGTLRYITLKVTLFAFRKVQTMDNSPLICQIRDSTRNDKDTSFEKFAIAVCTECGTCPSSSHDLSLALPTTSCVLSLSLSYTRILESTNFGVEDKIHKEKRKCFCETVCWDLSPQSKCQLRPSFCLSTLLLRRIIPFLSCSSVGEDVYRECMYVRRMTIYMYIHIFCIHIHYILISIFIYLYNSSFSFSHLLLCKIFLSPTTLRRH